MGKDYNKSAATAQRLIKKFGVAASFVRNEGIEDPDGWRGETELPISYPTTCCLIPLSSRDVALMSEGVSIATDSRCLMEAVELTEIPTVGDQVLINSEYWQILSISPLKPGTVDVLWDMAVRR